MDPVGNGGQGRTDSRSESGQRSCPKGEDRRMPIRVNRTIDTRIFSTAESPVRCKKAEDRKRVFARATEPPRLTEPIPSPTRGRRPSRTVSSRNAMAAAHRDRAGTEPSPASGVVPGFPRHVRYRPGAVAPLQWLSMFPSIHSTKPSSRAFFSAAQLTRQLRRRAKLFHSCTGNSDFGNSLYVHS